MHLATECMILFKGDLYKQIDGVDMRSPLGCTTANFFLGHLESVIFEKQLPIDPKFFNHCIDELMIISGFDYINACASFLNVLNSQHENIKFTNEKIHQNITNFRCRY